MRLCRAYRPQTKGKVESDVPYVRERLLRAHRFSSYEQANTAWEDWNEQIARKRVHSTHGEIVAVRAQRDHAALLALALFPYLVVERTTRIVARDGLFSWPDPCGMVLVWTLYSWSTRATYRDPLSLATATGWLLVAVATADEAVFEELERLAPPQAARHPASRMAASRFSVWCVGRMSRPWR